MAQHSNVARLRDADAAFDKADLNGAFALDGRWSATINSVSIGSRRPRAA